MRVLVAHNYYRQRGGEDQVFEDEVALLKDAGHDVATIVRHNTDFSGLGTIAVAAGTVWNQPAVSAVEQAARDHGADVVHFHNWLPQFSMASFAGARKSGAAVVQTIHNYRYTCAAGVLFRDNEICEECVGRKVGLPAIKYGCYRDSRVATIPLVTALASHRLLGTAERNLDAVILLSEFARAKLADAGLPMDRAHIKPNFVSPDPGAGPGTGGYILYLGRLIDNKGIATLLDAWSRDVGLPPLKIAGAGPMSEAVEDAAAAHGAIDYLGQVDPGDVHGLLANAQATVVPSLNYEGLPKTVVESFAAGTPVVASEIGSLAEIVEHGRNGLLVPVGDAPALAHAISDAVASNGLTSMRDGAREAYTSRYEPEANLERLIAVYESAIAHRRES